MNAPETQVRPAETSSETTTGTAPPPPPPPPPAPAGFWKLHHLVIGLVVLVVVIMMFRACGSDEDEAEVSSAGEQEQPRQAIAVQVPATQLPSQQPVVPPAGLRSQQPGYGYAPQQYAPQGYAPQVAPQVLQPSQPAAPSSNPWSTRTQPHSYGSYQSQHWGQPQRNRQQSYVQQPVTSQQYRPLEQPQAAAPAPAPAARPVAPQPQVYYPAAPYDSLSGSSFGNRVYPYGGAYPGQYGTGAYGVPGGVYTPGVVPGLGWPGYYR